MNQTILPLGFFCFFSYSTDIPGEETHCNIPESTGSKAVAVGSHWEKFFLSPHSHYTALSLQQTFTTFHRIALKIWYTSQ